MVIYFVYFVQSIPTGKKHRCWDCDFELAGCFVDTVNSVNVIYTTNVFD